MMPNAIEGAIKNMCEDAVTQAVTSLAEKHGFDCEEALRELNLGDLKLVRKRGPSPVEKSPRGKKSGGDKPKVKRGPTGYLLYGADVRPAVKEELTEALEEGTKLKPQDVVTEIAKRWKALSEEEQAAWKEQAAAAQPISDSDSVTEEVVVVKPKAKKAVAADEKPKAKRGPTGYLLYAADVRPAVKEELTEALEEGAKLKPQDVVTEIAKRWNALGEEEQIVWKAAEKTLSPTPPPPTPTPPAQKYVPTFKQYYPWDDMWVTLFMVDAEGSFDAAYRTQSVSGPPVWNTWGYIAYAEEVLRGDDIWEEMEDVDGGPCEVPLAVVAAVKTKWLAFSDEERIEWQIEAAGGRIWGDEDLVQFANKHGLVASELVTGWQSETLARLQGEAAGVDTETTACVSV